jgi:hypothetical protein
LEIYFFGEKCNDFKYDECEEYDKWSENCPYPIRLWFLYIKNTRYYDFFLHLCIIEKIDMDFITIIFDDLKDTYKQLLCDILTNVKKEQSPYYMCITFNQQINIFKDDFEYIAQGLKWFKKYNSKKFNTDVKEIKYWAITYL